MNDTIRVSDISVTYQGIQPAYVINKKGVSYCQIQGAFENDAIHLEYDILMKKNYVKKAKYDLVKDDSVVIQRKGNEFFILISIVSEAFQEGEAGKREAKKAVKKADYQYTYQFKEIDKKIVEKDTVQQNARQVFDHILKEHGINTSGNTPSDSYASTWKIGHPDEA